MGGGGGRSVFVNKCKREGRVPTAEQIQARKKLKQTTTGNREQLSEKKENAVIV